MGKEKVTENRDILLSHPYIFFATRNFWNTEEFPIKFLGNVRYKNLTEKLDISHSYPKNIFANKNFLKLKCSQLVFWVLWDKIF